MYHSKEEAIQYMVSRCVLLTILARPRTSAHCTVRFMPGATTSIHCV